jgi:hypothetical protein
MTESSNQKQKKLNQNLTAAKKLPKSAASDAFNVTESNSANHPLIRSRRLTGSNDGGFQLIESPRHVIH